MEHIQTQISMIQLDCTVHYVPPQKKEGVGDILFCAVPVGVSIDIGVNMTLSLQDISWTSDSRKVAVISLGLGGELTVWVTLT